MDNGIINQTSPYPVAETIDRLEAALRSKGLKIFARIDQKAEAEGVGLTMRPTQLLIFGDPKGGTPLMNAHPSIALDLPLKALVWEAEDGQVWLSYNSPAYLQTRHRLSQEPFGAIVALLGAVLQAK